MQVVNPFSRALTIAATGQTAAPGEPVDVPDDIGASLLDQGWRAPKTKPKTATAETTED